MEQAVAEILADAEANPWLLVQIEEQEEETFRQATRGRPGEQTKYLRQTRSRYTLTWTLNLEALSEAEREDGVFPLLTNDRKLDATEVLRAYKRQPLLEKRFSQFKTDFAVAPVYLKDVSRIQGLLAAYFFALLVQTLLERELREGWRVRVRCRCRCIRKAGRAHADDAPFDRGVLVHPTARDSSRRGGTPSDGDQDDEDAALDRSATGPGPEDLRAGVAARRPGGK